MSTDIFREHLKLQDVALWACNFAQPNDTAEFPEDEIEVEGRHALAKCEQFTAQAQDGSEKDFLRAFCQFGVRTTASGSVGKGSPAKKKPTVLAQVEATFTVLFSVDKAISKSHLDDFFAKSCAHVCWPFWRQHVFDTLKRASLPLAVIPLSCPTSPAPTVAKRKSKR